MKNFYSSFLSILLLLGAGNFSASATTETLGTGSFIINMGVVPQTIANGLKPYGLVYELVKTYRYRFYTQRRSVSRRHFYRTI